MVKRLNGDNYLRRSSVFSGRPWKVEVERVEGIEPSTKAWEAFVLPLNYTRTFFAPFALGGHRKLPFFDAMSTVQDVMAGACNGRAFIPEAVEKMKCIASFVTSIPGFFQSCAERP
jgi:hypothetical protein